MPTINHDPPKDQGAQDAPPIIGQVRSADHLSSGTDYTSLPQRTPKQRRSRTAALPSAYIEGRSPKSTEEVTALVKVQEDQNAQLQERVSGVENARPSASEAATNLYETAAALSNREHEHVPAYRSAAEPGQKFEYLDHTADVQLHAWGSDLREAFENVGLCMFNYMTPLTGIAAEGAEHRTFSAEGHDLPSLLYHWLDELLFGFSTDFFVASSLHIVSFDREKWQIKAEARGEIFDRVRHVCGTEIKAITYSAMQINETSGDAEVFVIVDI